MAAGDFYFAINATFRFILHHFGKKELERYWTAMGQQYFAPLAERFRRGGLPEVERYWSHFFEREPGGRVVVSRGVDRVEIEVQECPALSWLREQNRETVECYCEHCEFVSKAVADRAGMKFYLVGGGGSCHQTFSEEACVP